MMKKLLFVPMVFLVISLLLTQRAISQDSDIVGTFFGDPVSKGNYSVILRTVLKYHTPWGGIPDNGIEAEKRVWDELILSYEAHRREIPVRRDEIEDKITKILKGYDVDFIWKESPQQYEQWIKENLKISVTYFENQMRHLVQINKLHQQVLDSINPDITEEEAFQEFLNEANSLSVELAEFDMLEEAQQFYEKVQNDPESWKKAARKDKELIPEDRTFRRPGFVALEFLIDMWGFPKKSTYDMIEMKVGEIYPPAPIYEGYGVFKILDIRRADETVFDGREESYFKQLRTKAKYDGFNDWLRNLRKSADIQIFIDPPHELFQ